MLRRPHLLSALCIQCAVVTFAKLVLIWLWRCLRGGCAGRRRALHIVFHDALAFMSSNASRTIKGHLVHCIFRAQKQAHAVIIGVAVHPGAIIVHSTNKLSVLDRTSSASLRRLRWSRTAIVLDKIVCWSKCCSIVAPIVEGELAAWGIASNNSASPWMTDPKINGCIAGIANILGMRATIKGQIRAINFLHHLAVPISGAALLRHLELEWQCPAIHETDVDPIYAVCTKACLKLCIHWWCASKRAVTYLPRATALTNLTHVPKLVAPHLGPIPRSSETVRSGEGVRFPTVKPKVLWVRPHTCLRHVGNPEWFLVASIGDAEPLAIN
mmetsp:Transcript_37715/g.94650  ORF Transcript_37715/g.94650 Transcript_37715/m.94650 type:complete len:327 (-) Transcript_37715:110-1090(-)